MEYEPEQPWLPASEQLLDWSDDFHRLMLGDQLRMDAYRAAVAESVRPGDTVLDLGTGTGILARWALEAGAARVYGIDLNKSILDTAVERLTVLGLVDRFVPLHGLSFDLELPERVDLVISEILGNLADNENAPAILGDARQRFLRPGGRMLPSRVESYLVPVAAERAHRRLREGSPADAGGAEAFAALLGRRGSRSAFDLYYDTILPLSGYLAAPRILRAFDLTAAPEPSDYRVRWCTPVVGPVDSPGSRATSSPRWPTRWRWTSRGTRSGGGPPRTVGSTASCRSRPRSRSNRVIASWSPSAGSAPGRSTPSGRATAGKGR